MTGGKMVATRLDCNPIGLVSAGRLVMERTVREVVAVEVVVFVEKSWQGVVMVQVPAAAAKKKKGKSGNVVVESVVVVDGAMLAVACEAKSVACVEKCGAREAVSAEWETYEPL